MGPGQIHLNSRLHILYLYLLVILYYMSMHITRHIDKVYILICFIICHAYTRIILFILFI